MGEAMKRIIEWQLEKPDGTKQEAIAYAKSISQEF